MSQGQLESVEFEVSGHVQDPFRCISGSAGLFKKYVHAVVLITKTKWNCTKKKANELSLKGFVKNTRSGTVVGAVQGTGEYLKIMMDWLRHEGSPASRIDKCEFKNHRKIKNYDYRDFAVHH